MLFLRRGYRRNGNDDLVLFLLLAVGVLLFLSPWLAHWIDLPSLCLFKQTVGLSCPGCGLSRAGAHLATWDPPGAFRLNPLILFIAPYCAYRLVAILVGIVTSRILVQDWPLPFLRLYQWSFIAVWFVLAAVRVTAWLFPGVAAELHLPFCEA
ncbi:MAG: DUF2752 domain-containing protein [bacterium]